jgi:hypothetical protein
VVFKDGDAALTQELDPGFVVIDAANAMAHFGKANGGYESYIPGPDYADGHWVGHQLCCLLRIFSPKLAM